MPPVTILCSGVHLGVYVPGMLVEARLRALGVPAEVEVLEAFYKTPDREALEELREATHRSFRFALMARRMTRDTSDSLDDALLDALFARWRREGRRRFVVWSGFWLPVLERYRAMMGGDVDADHCRIDAVVSPSFDVYPHLDGAGRGVWLWNGAEGRLEHRVPVDAGPPVPFKMREARCVAHGGGWGVGTYRDRIPELRAAGLSLDVVAYRDDEVAPAPGDRIFRVDPAWRPWMTDEAGQHHFPPFAQAAPEPAGEYPRRTDRHGLFDLAATSLAILSKPGGGTLIDSLESATPLVLLEPYGAAEEANGKVWEALGLGIGYEAWRASGFSREPLEACHHRLIEARAATPDYCERYAGEVLATA